MSRCGAAACPGLRRWWRAFARRAPASVTRLLDELLSHSYYPNTSTSKPQLPRAAGLETVFAARCRGINACPFLSAHGLPRRFFWADKRVKKLHKRLILLVLPKRSRLSWLKREVWEAFKKVKANQGAAGVDGQTIADFEADLSNNLYELWNRLSSGSYFPPPMRRVDIPKVDGGSRPLGIPTVADRVAQEVVRRYLEPRLEPVFHADSYGYRPGKSAIDAVRQARQRCWRYDWVLDIDVPTALRPASWCCILRRQESSTARMRTGVATSRTNRSIFSVSVSERGKRCGKVFFPRTASCPPSARRHSRPSAGQSGDGRFISAVTSPCRTWPTCTIRTLGAGSTTTANSIERS